jgi:hypothetical protein
MNRKQLASFIGASGVAAMLGCSTSPPVQPALEVLDIPPPEISFDLPLEPPDSGRVPRLCKLGTSCLAMDPRPFEPCLLSTTSECRDKLPEPIAVVEPEWIDPSALPIKTP